MAAKLRVLVVDDFATMRQLVKNFLHELGYSDVQEANDGTTALPILKGGGIDILVTDWNMPGMSGLELIRKVRADPQLEKLPVLMVTAEARYELIKEALNAGVNGYVVKPFTAKSLQECIEQILDGRHPR
jgi:two-component system chemotaxis response regulator CheY